MEIAFPFEFVVRGVPMSSGASSASKERWRRFVQASAAKALPEDHFAAEGEMSVVIIYFSLAASSLDTDNMLKSILDALNRFVWIDDRQVLQVLCRRTDRAALIEFRNPTPVLAEALASDGAFVYVRVDEGVRHEELP